MKQNISIIPQVFRNHPTQAMKLTRGFSRLNKAMFWDYYFGRGKSSELPLVTFKITPLCNLRCMMCGQNGIHGTLKDCQEEESHKIVPIERYMQLTDELAGKTEVFYIWGGEPFLYPNFMDLAAYMAKKLLLTVNTNGTWLAQNAERIVRDKWTGIFISLDGFEDVNDRIRGEGVYQRVMEGIAAVNREKEKQGSSLPYMGVVTTISMMNYLWLDKLAAALADKGLSWHIINLGTYLNAEIGADHEKHLQKVLGIQPKYWKGFATGLNEGIDGNAFSEVLKRVHALPVDYPIITVPGITPDSIGALYNDLRIIVRDKCAAPWFSANINYNGDVAFCADYPDWIIGNVKDTPMLEIYNNERAVKFRKALKNSPHGLFPACNRCYQLMLCGRRVKGY
jgi:radical SAM protein with 4Fe4S-binding SPASM domain